MQSHQELEPVVLDDEALDCVNGGWGFMSALKSVTKLVPNPISFNPVSFVAGVVEAHNNGEDLFHSVLNGVNEAVPIIHGITAGIEAYKESGSILHALNEGAQEVVPLAGMIADAKDVYDDTHGNLGSAATVLVVEGVAGMTHTVADDVVLAGGQKYSEVTADGDLSGGDLLSVALAGGAQASPSAEYHPTNAVQLDSGSHTKADADSHHDPAPTVTVSSPHDPNPVTEAVDVDKQNEAEKAAADKQT